MTIDHLISELGAHAGLPSLELDANRACCLIFDDEIHLQLEAHPDDAETLLLQTVVGTVPPEDKAPFCRRLLAANLGRSQEGIFAIVPENREVVLWWSYCIADMAVEHFAELLSAAVASARRATAELSQATEPPDSDVTSQLPELTAMIRV